MLFGDFVFFVNEQFGVKRAETKGLPGNSLEAMLKMLSPEDIEKCCKEMPDDLRGDATSSAAAKKDKKKKPNKNKNKKRKH